jgi:hypothetical protein
MKQQYGITHAIRQNEISFITRSWIINTASLRMLCPQNLFALFSRKNIAYLTVGGLRIGQCYSLFCRILYWCSLLNPMLRAPIVVIFFRVEVVDMTVGLAENIFQ